MVRMIKSYKKTISPLVLIEMIQISRLVALLAALDYLNIICESSKFNSTNMCAVATQKRCLIAI